MPDVNFTRTNVDPNIEGLMQAALQAQQQKNSMAIVKAQMQNQSAPIVQQSTPIQRQIVPKAIGKDPLDTMAQLEDIKNKVASRQLEQQKQQSVIQQMDLENKQKIQEQQKQQAFSQAIAAGNYDAAKAIDPIAFTSYLGKVHDQNIQQQKLELAQQQLQAKLTNAPETAIDRENAKIDAKAYADLNAQANQALGVKSDARRMVEVLKQITTGTGGNQIQAARTFLGSFMTPEQQSRYGSLDNSALGAQMNQFSNDARLAILQKLKGAISDREQVMYSSGIAGLDKTPAANMQLTQLLQAGAQKTLDQKAFVDYFANKFHGDKRAINNAMGAWQKWIQENPDHDIVRMEGKRLIINPDAVGDWKGWINSMQTPTSYLDMKPTTEADQQRVTVSAPHKVLTQRIQELERKKAGL